MRRVLVTGASGYVARHLIAALAEQADTEVIALTRRPEALPQHSRIITVEGSVLDADAYRSRLADLDAVVHLAAVTGKAPPEAFERVNVEGTARLVDACRTAGAPRFLYASTVAVGYPNVTRYPYARSKRRAEAVVRESGLPYTILRPTIVLGAGSAAWDSFASLVRPSLVVVPGGGAVHVQPVHVEDVVATVTALLDAESFEGNTYGLGGPERLTIRDFLERAHTLCHGGSSHVVTLPLGLVLPVLGMAERVAFSLVPATTGQFSVFQYDSTVGDGDLPTHVPPPAYSVEQMLAECCS